MSAKKLISGYVEKGMKIQIFTAKYPTAILRHNLNEDE
jgi:hypothetical protein